MAIQFLNNPKVGDNVKIEIGDSSDLQIYHDATNSFITNSTGDFTISNTGDDLILKSADDFITYVNSTAIAIHAIGGAGVKLRFNSSNRFETTSTGVSVTGGIVFGDSHFIGDDSDDNLLIQSSANENIIINSLDDLLFRTSGTTQLQISSTSATFTGNVNTGRLFVEQSGADIIDMTRTGVGTYRFAISGSDAFSLFDVGANADRLVVDSSGKVAIGTTTASSKLTVQDNSYQVMLVDTSTSNRGEISVEDAAFGFYADRAEATADSSFFWSIDNLNKMEINLLGGGEGQLRLNDYGPGNITGTAEFILGVDANGNVIETSAGGSGTVTGTGAATRVAFWSGTTALSSDANLYWDNTNDRLGIGTTSPNFKTHLYDSGNTVLGITAGLDNYAALQFGRTSDTTRGAIEFYTGDDSLRLKTGNNAEKMRITSAGNVGIGVTAPSAKLEIDGNVKIGDATTGATFAKSGNDFLITGVDTGGNGFNSIHLKADSLDTGLYIEKDTNNVGIGTTSPTYGKLVISSSIASSSVYNWLVFDNQASGYGDWNIYKSGNNNLAFGYGTTAGNSYSNAFTLEYGGNVGIGHTSPDAKLHVDAPSTTANSLTFGATAGQIFTNENSEFAFGLLNASPFPLYIQGRTSTNTARNITLQGLGGNIGIGTYSPAVELQVKGGAEIFRIEESSATGSPFMTFFQNGTRRSLIQHLDSGDLLSLVSEYGGIRMMTGTAGTEVERMRIHADGQVEFKKGAAQIKITDTDDNKFAEISYSSSFLSLRNNTTTSTHFVLDESGNVGIGTTAPDVAGFPSSTLTVEGSSGNYGAFELGSASQTSNNGRLGEIRFYNKESANPYGFASIRGLRGLSAGDSQISFFTASSNTATERMRITSAGNVGIGRVPTSHILETAGEIKLTSLGANEGIDAFNTSSLQWGIKSVSSTVAGVSFEVANTERMRIGSDGFVFFPIASSVGTSTATIRHNSNNYLYVNGGTSGALFGNSDQTVRFQANSTNLELITNGSTRMLISSAGNVGIGTTDPSQKLEVRGNSLADKSLGIRTNYATQAGWSPATTLSSATGFFGGNFTGNGANTENNIAYGENEKGQRGLIWKAQNNDAASGPDGGWNKTIANLDNNMGYMSIVYVKRVGTNTSGNFYHGCLGTNTLNLSGSANTNPYFRNFGISNLPQDVWCVSIGIIQANNDSNTTNQPIGGVYRLDTGEKITAIGTAVTFKMRGANNSQSHRTYLYYSTSSAAELNWSNPGFYAMDGSEPTLSEIVEGENTSGDYLPLTGGTLTGDLTISEATPVLILKDSNGTTPSNTLGYVVMQEADGTEVAFVGMGSGSNNQLYLSGNAGTTVNIRTNASTAIFIDTSQNVGIGVTAPAAKLEVSGTVKISHESGSQTSPTTQLLFDNDNIDNGGGYNIDFKTSSNDTANRFMSRIQALRGSGAISSLGFFTETGSALNRALLLDSSQNATFSGSINMSDSQPINYGGQTMFTHTGSITKIGDNTSSSTLSITGGKLGIGTTNPGAKLDIQPTASDRKVIKIANDVMSTYNYTSQVDAVLAWTCGSYHQAEVVITANQTNSGTYNNIYIRGIWSNNHTSHHWDELERIGSLTGSTFTMSVGQNGSTTNSGRLELDFDYVNGSFSQLNVRVTDFFGTHSYTIT